MNNLFKKISGLALGLALTLGAGISAFTVGNGAVKADAATFSKAVTDFKLGEKAYENTINVNSNPKDAIKLGTSKAIGSATATLPVGTKNVVLYAAGWSEKTSKLNLTVNGTSKEFSLVSNSGITGNGPFTLSLSGSTTVETFKVEFTLDSALTNETNITFSTVSGACRAVFWDVVANGSDSSADVTSISFKETSTFETDYITTEDSWDFSGLDVDITVNPADGEKPEVTYSANIPSPIDYVYSNGYKEVENGTVSITAKAGKKEVTKDFTKINVSYATTDDVLPLIPNADDTYTKVIVKGVISKIEKIDTTNGNANFYIENKETGTALYIYKSSGLNGEEITSENDILVSDKVVLYGELKNYNGTKEMLYSEILLLERSAANVKIEGTPDSLGIGETVQLTAKTSNCPTETVINWKSDNTAVATVNNGLVEGVSEGSAVITAEAVNGSTVGASSSVTILVTKTLSTTGYFEKVVSEKTDFTGTYLLVAHKGEANYVFNAVDSANGYQTATIEDDKISDYKDLVPVEIAKTGSGYSLKVTTGNNANKYLSGTNNSNKLNFNTTSVENQISWNENGTVSIISNGSYLVFNSTTNNLRFRYYKSTTVEGDTKGDYPHLNLYEYKDGSTNTEQSDKEVVDTFVKDYIDLDVAYDNVSDTGACRGTKGYYAKAKDAYNKLTAEQKALFATDTAYLNARTRLAAWATANGEVFNPTDYTFTKVSASGLILKVMNENNSYVIIIIAGLVAASALVAYLVINNKRKNSK